MDPFRVLKFLMSSDVTPAGLLSCTRSMNRYLSLPGLQDTERYEGQAVMGYLALLRHTLALNRQPSVSGEETKLIRKRVIRDFVRTADGDDVLAVYAFLSLMIERFDGMPWPPLIHGSRTSVIRLHYWVSQQLWRHCNIT